MRAARVHLYLLSWHTAFAVCAVQVPWGALTSATLLGCLQFSTILDSYKQHSKGWSSTFNKYAEGEGSFLVGTLLCACLTVSSWAALSMHGSAQLLLP